MFGGAYKGKRVLLTGQTGFKGAWLAHWLLALGAEVRGFALAPQADQPLHDWLDIGRRCRSEFADVRDREALRSAVRAFQPDFVLHLAAQPLVRLSYQIPVETIETNVMGTWRLCKLALPHLVHQTGKGQGQLAQRPRHHLFRAAGAQIAVNRCDRLCIQPHTFLRPQGRYIA